jgi:hypothetical protein
LESKYSFLIKDLKNMDEYEKDNFFGAMIKIGPARFFEIQKGMREGENFDDELEWAITPKRFDEKIAVQQISKYVSELELWKKNKTTELGMCEDIKVRPKGKETGKYLFIKLSKSGREIICETCKIDYWLTIHHIDGDHDNNEIENLAILCWNHHLGDAEGKGYTKKEIMEMMEIGKEN